MTLKSKLSFGSLMACVWFSALTTCAEDVVYSTQVAPVLRTYCVSCHSRVEAQSGLSLQAPDDILKGSENGKVLDSADPAQSRLLEVLASQGDDHMPPSDQPQPSEAEQSLLTAWLKAGAPFDSRMAVLPVLPKVRVTAQNFTSPVLAMRMGTDGKSIFSGKFRSVEQHSVQDGTLLWNLQVPDGKVNSLRLSKDGTRLLLATGTPGISGRALEVSVGQSAIQREFAGHDDILYAAEWSPDERIVATAGYDRRIVLHDAQTGVILRELTGHNGAIFDLKFNPDGTLLASASADATIKIWHVATGERFDTLSQPQSEQYSVAFSPDGRFIFGSGADSRIRQWQLVSLTAPQINPLLISRFAHEGAVIRSELSADGRYLVTASDAGSVKLWDAQTVNELSAETLSDDLVSSLVFDQTAGVIRVATAKGRAKTILVPTIESAPLDSPAPAETLSAGNAMPLQDVAESEPNDSVDLPQLVTFPSRISGLIHATATTATAGTTVTETADTAVSETSTRVPDVDTFRFQAHKGQQILIEVRAARDNSPLDSTVEILHADGTPVLQTQLQAVRDSYFTFRGKDSDTADDFRLFNWQEMELNEYLYADGEVVKLWLYPRGPDSGFKVYPGLGSRQTYFGTTPTTHPLQGPAFIVVPHKADAVLKSTGLPVFPVYYQNDDDPMRQWGKDSRLVFHAPADGSYLVRLTDARGFQGTDFKYQLLLRIAQPDFTVAMAGDDLNISLGTGREIGFTATRLDGYDGPIEIFAEHLPAGFSLSDPVIIQDEQRQAFATLIAAADAVQPADDAVALIKFKARAQTAAREIVHEIGGMKSLKVIEKPKVLVRILTPEQQAAGQIEQTAELTVWAGETTRAILKVERLDHTGLVEFGNEDSGRNMPHGVFIDNIGLNGLMLLEGQDEREFFITTAKWVPETSRPFYLRSRVDGGITSLPVMLHIRHRTTQDAKTAAR